MNLPCRFGRYTLLEKVACGGTAEIYRAVLCSQGGFEKTVAVKKLLPSWSASDELCHMLIDEGRALCHLAHQTIVQVHELGIEDGTPFLAMEYVDGIDVARLLAHLLREGERLPVPHLLYIAGEVLTALDFAHRSAGADGAPLCIVHRDISPSNIMLSRNGEVKVTDFGIAKGSHRTRLTASGQIRGKYSYMAPEQARGDEIDARADLFACGIVLFELAAARRLLEAPSDIELLRKVAAGDFSLEGIDSLPSELRAILLLSLRVDRKARYQSAAEMLADVKRARRSVGDMSGSLELAAYLRERFSDLACERLPCSAKQRSRAQPTKLLTEAPLPGVLEPGRVARFESLGLQRWRLAFVALILVGMTTVPPARGSASRAAALKHFSSAHAMQQSSSLARLSGAEPAALHEPTPPPALAGAIVVESVPSGVAGTLTIDGVREEIRTPFAREGMPIGHGVQGRVELAGEGFKPQAESFRLAPESALYVHTFRMQREGSATLSVNARPWGLVFVSGSVKGCETPVTGLKLKAGTHRITVRHPPTGKEVQTTVALKHGERLRCLAVFHPKAGLSCR